MDDDVKQQLFTSFFSTKGSNGTGLGLLVTQKIVQEHGGTLSVSSESGKGSAFTIHLPQKREDV
jgi:signal transduction histidine kinase